MKPVEYQYKINLGDQTFVFESGKLAAQAGGSVTLRLGDTMIFAAATMNPEPRQIRISFRSQWIMKSECTLEAKYQIIFPTRR